MLPPHRFPPPMWLLALSVPVLPGVLIIVFNHYHANIRALCRRALGWTLRLARGGSVCVKSTHAYVFSHCTHGNAQSVLEAFDCYNETHPSLCLGPQRGQVLDEVLRRVGPQCVLELGMHCGYSSIRMLRLLPPAGRLLTVEMDSSTAELGEELILVAGFKDLQFHVLACSSAEAIPALRPHLAPGHGDSAALDLVLMDHDPQRYLSDLLALERETLLRPSGCHVLLVKRGQCGPAFTDLMKYFNSCTENYSVMSEHHLMTEVFYHEDTSHSRLKQ